MLKLLTLGDSVCWGQGLTDSHKFYRIVGDKLRADCSLLAHSGAVIRMLAGDDEAPEFGEVPLALPSMRRQIETCSNPTETDFIIVNGGINDIDFRRILSPLTSTSDLAALCKKHCGNQMALLLEKAGQSFIKHGAQVFVIGYYPIFSPDSTHFVNPAQLTALFEMYGISAELSLNSATVRLAPVPFYVQNCMTFWKESNKALQAAVDGANNTFQNQPRFSFVKLPFSERNAMFASDPLLWGLRPDSTAEDEVLAERKLHCDRLYGDVAGVFKLMQCYRASTGHPNVAGSQKIAEAILSHV